MDVPLSAIDTRALEDAVADRFMRAVGGKVHLSRHGHIENMFLAIPDSLSTIDALALSIIPLVDHLIDDISIQTKEPWPSNTEYSAGTAIEENPDSITLVLTSLRTGEELARLDAIPFSLFVAPESLTR